MDMITIKEIKRDLCFEADVEVFESVDSTNTVAAERMLSGCREWHTVVAKSQHNGVGRLGRSFFSPEGSGIYMSCVLYPDAEKIGRITGIAAVAVCRAIEKVCGVSAGIKWVNDIFLGGKKVCGILAISKAAGESRGVILGIGINVYPPREGFPNDITHTAGYLAENEREGLKNILISSILNELFALYNSDGDVAEEYRRRCITLEKRVRVIPAGGVGALREGVALYVDDSFGLRVRYDDGTEETVTSGEVSVRFDNK